MKDKLKTYIENHLQGSILKNIDLSRENLSISDYEWLGKMMQKSSSIESIRLPNISKENAETILTILDKATVKNSILREIVFNFSFPDHEISNRLLLIMNQIKSRLERNDNGIIGIHGGGNMGLGLFADIISKSPFPYRLLATSSNKFLRKLVNSKNKLWLKHENDEMNQARMSCVDRVSMISRKPEDIIRLYQESSFVALCVKADVLFEIASTIANAIYRRYQKDGSGIKILILMNQPNCDQFANKIIFDEFKKIVAAPALINRIWSNVEFVPSVIDRIVSPLNSTQIKLQLREQLNLFRKHKLKRILKETDVDRIIASDELLIKAVNEFNLTFALFKAEFNFTMYVRDNFIEAHRFPLIRMQNDLSMLETIKSVYINGPHAVLAWFGALLGFETIAEAIRHPSLFSFIKRMMQKEIGPILLKEYPTVTKEELEQLEQSFVKRCEASVDDKVTRVGQDPLRKLNIKGRIRFPLELAEKHKLTIKTPCLEDAIAVGFLYGIKNPTNPGCEKVNEIYEINHRSLLALLRYQGPAPSGNFTGLTDDQLINNVLNKIKVLNHLSDRNKTIGFNQHQSSTALILARQTSCINQDAFIPKVMMSKMDHSFVRTKHEAESKALFYIWIKKELKNKEDEMVNNNILQIRYRK